MAVILEDLRDCALIDALQTELPLTQLQEASTCKIEKQQRRDIYNYHLNYLFSFYWFIKKIMSNLEELTFISSFYQPLKLQANNKVVPNQWYSNEKFLNFIQET